MLENFFDKFKDELNKDKEFKQSMDKFRQETDQLEKSEEMQKMRHYYTKIESEVRNDMGDKVREKVNSAKESLSKEMDGLRKHEYVSKALDSTSRAATAARQSVTQAGQSLADSDALDAVRRGVTNVEQEIRVQRIHVYQRPTELQTRSQLCGGEDTESTVVEANDEASGVVLHKDSRWQQAWTGFKDNNAYARKIFDLKTQYDESDNVMARGGRFVTERLSSIFGGMFTSTEMSGVLTEVAKMDPYFTVESFLAQCRTDIIPNVLEAQIRGDLVVLRDWCHEAAYNVYAQPVTQCAQLGYVQDSRVLDVSQLDLAQARITEQGPVLVITFIAQQVQCVRALSDGRVVEGDPDKVLRVTHVWALCRDMSELKPRAAWRVLEMAMLPSEQWL